MSKVEPVPHPASRLLEHSACLAPHRLPRPQQRGGIQVPLDRHGSRSADALPRGAQRCPPVDADRVAAGSVHLSQQLPGSDTEVDRRDLEIRERFEELLRERRRKGRVVVGVQRSRPRIEDLERLHAGRHLRSQVRHDDPDQRLHQPRPIPLVHQRLRSRERSRCAALHKVGREGERRAREPDERDAELLAKELDRFDHVRDLLHVAPRQAIDVGGIPQRLFQHRSATRLDPDRHAERREGRHDVPEQDRRVERHPPQRLQRQLGDLLRLADRFEDVPVPSELSVLRQVATRLAHEPDGRPVHRRAPERAEDPVVEGGHA